MGGLDNDGQLDEFVGFRGRPNRLYKQDHGRFTDVAAVAGIADNVETRDTGGGYCSQNVMPVHVAAGDAASVDIEVTSMSTRGRRVTTLRTIRVAERSSRVVRVSVSRP